MAYYNGKKVIGNAKLDLGGPVYEFAKSEYEKSVNLFDEKLTLGNINESGVFYYDLTGAHLLAINYIKAKPNTVYSYKTSKSGLWVFEYDADKKFLNKVDIVRGKSFTSNSNTAYFRVAFWASYGTTYLNDAIVKEGTDPLYYPYNGEHITKKNLKEYCSFIENVSIYDASITNDTVGSILPLRYSLNGFSAIYIQFYHTGGKIYGKYIPIHILKTKHASQWNAVVVGELNDEYITLYYSSDTTLTVGARSTNLNSMRIFAI